MTLPGLHTLRLDGCAPMPLASYLKALGILRLISSPANHVDSRAADPHARGWWANERFHLRTTLLQEELEQFFLEQYAPSPIIAPWNGRAGFLEGEDGERSTRTGAELMRRFSASPAPRFANMRRTIDRSRGNDELIRLNRLRAKKKALEKELKTYEGPEKQSKEKEKNIAAKMERQSKQVLLPAMRSATESDHLSYVDACYVLSTDQTPMPLLGSGGNDGSRDFGVNFAEEMTRLFGLDDGRPTDSGKSSLNGALLGGGRLEICGTMGQFNPGQGGSNATTGYEGENPLNPWDVVLAMEGSIVFAGALTRGWGAVGGSRASFPFSFEATRAAAANFSSEDPNRPRGEIWVPLWKKPAAFTEVVAIFSEGRLTLGGRAARTGLDAARSVARIGLARGISSFERYSLLQPDSRVPYQATPLGRISTPDHPRRDLIADLETGDWLGRIERLVNGRTAPSRARYAKRRLDDSLFQMANAGSAPEGTRNALVAIGGVVEWLTTNPKAREDLGNPPPRLSQDWIRQADDRTPEFRVAAALASLGLPASMQARRIESPDSAGASGVASAAATLGDSPEPLAHDHNVSGPPMAAHFAPIDIAGFVHGKHLSQRRKWAGTDSLPTVVWGAGSLTSNMIAVLERRLIAATMCGFEDKPLSGATWARAQDIAAFLFGNFDDVRCAALLRGLVWVAPTILPSPTRLADTSTPTLPFAYATLKPIFSTDGALRRVGTIDSSARISVPPGFLPILRAAGHSTDGRTADAAVRAALACARGAGLISPFDSPITRRGTFSRIGAGIRADRLGASLLIPIGDASLATLIDLAYNPASTDGTTPTEDINHAT